MCPPNPNFPAPSPAQYTTPGDIRVSVETESKDLQFRERRIYRSDGEDSRYRIQLRYNRV